MRIVVESMDGSRCKGDAVILVLYEGQVIGDVVASAGLAEQCPWTSCACGFGDFHATRGETAIYYGDGPVSRLVCVGLGKLEETNLAVFRDAIALAARKCRDLGLTSAILPVAILEYLPGGRDRLVEEGVYAFCIGLYQFVKYRTLPDERPAPAEMTLGLWGADRRALAAASIGQISADAVAMARDLANMPGNDLFPESLSVQAMEIAANSGLSCHVLDDKALIDLKAGCILAVGRGSGHPPCMIILEYAREGEEQEKPLILVGKGITFDSGGLCLKPPTNMNQMKCDMSGAAAVLATLSMCKRLNVPGRVVGILACAENMPDGRACRPGDILHALNGQTVEVVNTDAEGRLVLADALAYAGKNWTPKAIVDIATLTGACAVALGTELAGIFGENDDFVARIRSLGKVAGENYWQLPLWEPYTKALKSEIADIKHTASREGGAITAALFLKNFVPPGGLWVHLDMAGVDWCQKNVPLCPEGATGFGTRTLLALVRGGVE